MPYFYFFTRISAPWFRISDSRNAASTGKEKHVKGFVLGVIATVLLFCGGVYAYFAGGFAPVGTAAQAMPFEKKLARMALHARVEKEMPKSAPIEGSEANYLAGAHGYIENCAVCHGLPNKAKTAIAAGEFPRPPQLFTGHGVTDDSAGETYWKTANGIRLTGMPAFKDSLSETEMWQISLLLANADKLPPTVTAALTEQPSPTAPPAAATLSSGKKK
jgi:mono/diheme cytochrome c family protein